MSKASSYPLLPRFSIVCVVHNQVHDVMNWMRQAMASQTPEWEMLIVDASSEDGTRELVVAMTHMERRIRFLPCALSHWQDLLRSAVDQTLGGFVLVQFPGQPLPDLDQLMEQEVSGYDALDLSGIGGGVWPACKRGFWVHSAIDAVEHQPLEEVQHMLRQEGAAIVACQSH